MTTPPILPKAVEQTIEEVRGLLGRFLGPTCDEIGGMFADKARLTRLERELSLLRKTLKIVDEAGFKPKVVNWRTMFPLLDSAVLEDDENMVERWASLLASAADPNSKSNSETAFIEILKQLPPSHALVLDVFYEQVERRQLPPEDWNECGYSISTLRSYLSKEVSEFDLALDNLLRLQLVRLPTVQLGIANGNAVRFQVTSTDILCPTSLGMAFVSSCGRGRTPRWHSYSVPGNSVKNLFWTKGGSLHLWQKDIEDSTTNR